MADVEDQDFAKDVAEWFDEYTGRLGPGVAYADAAQVFEALARWLRRKHRETA
jgi:hypothetical protein